MQKTFNCGFNKAFEACKQALSDLNIDIDSSNKSDGVINASTGSSLLSWGEDIQILVDEINTNKTKVTIKSESQAQLISWGKNDKNREEIMSKISKRLSK